MDTDNSVNNKNAYIFFQLHAYKNMFIIKVCFKFRSNATNINKEVIRIVYELRNHPSYSHYLRSSSLKLLGQSKPFFMEPP